MEPHFDPAKDAINQDRHQLSLAFGDRIFEEPAHLVLPTIRAEDNEDRFKVVGLVDGQLYTGVFVWRDDRPRFISVRRSNPREQREHRDPR